MNASQTTDSLRSFVLASLVGAGGHRLDAGQGNQPPPHRFNPLAVDSSPFITRVLDLYARCGDAQHLELPRWALYDCGELPGAIVGYAETIDDQLIPRSMGVFIPMLEPGAWHVYALTQAKPALIERTLRLGIELLAPRALTTIVRWESDLLEAVCAIAQPQIVTAWTVAHEYTDSMMLRVAFNQTHPPATARRSVPRSGAAEHRGLQGEIENRKQFVIQSVEQNRLLLGETSARSDRS